MKYVKELDEQLRVVTSRIDHIRNDFLNQGKKLNEAQRKAINYFSKRLLFVYGCLTDITDKTNLIIEEGEVIDFDFFNECENDKGDCNEY